MELTKNKQTKRFPSKKYNKARKGFLDDLKSILSINPKATEACFSSKEDIKLKEVFDENMNLRKKYTSWIKQHVLNILEADEFLEENSK